MNRVSLYLQERFTRRAFSNIQEQICQSVEYAKFYGITPHIQQRITELFIELESLIYTFEHRQCLYDLLVRHWEEVAEKGSQKNE